jgi:hypothetical protein
MDAAGELSSPNKSFQAGAVSSGGTPLVWAERPNFKPVVPVGGEPKEDEPDGPKFRYGEIFMEENGSVIPYLIIPSELGRDPEGIMSMVVRHMHHLGKPIEKPAIAFDIRARGASYLQWARDAFDNGVLREKWGWDEADFISFADEASEEDRFDCAVRDFGDKLLNVFADGAKNAAFFEPFFTKK